MLTSRTDAVPHCELGKYDPVGEGADVACAGSPEQVSLPTSLYVVVVTCVVARVRLANQEKQQGGEGEGEKLSISESDWAKS